MLFPCILAFALSLNGSWDFRFEEGKALEDAPDAGFAATDVIVFLSWTFGTTLSKNQLGSKVQGGMKGFDPIV